MTVRPARVWRHLPWGRMPVWLQYTPWRVSCSRCGARSWLGTVDAARLRQIYRQFGADPAKANETRTGARVCALPGRRDRKPHRRRLADHHRISTTTPGCWHPAPVDRGGPRGHRPLRPITCAASGRSSRGGGRRGSHGTGAMVAGGGGAEPVPLEGDLGERPSRSPRTSVPVALRRRRVDDATLSRRCSCTAAARRAPSPGRVSSATRRIPAPGGFVPPKAYTSATP